MSDTERIERCFWCGKPKDSTIIETEDTIKNSVITNYVPCDSCKEIFSKGIHVIGVTKEPIVKGMFPISKDGDNSLYPTGSMFVANEEFINTLLTEESEQELKKNVLKERMLMLQDELVTQIVEDARKAEQGEDLDTYIDNELEGSVSNEENV